MKVATSLDADRPTLVYSHTPVTAAHQSVVTNREPTRLRVGLVIESLSQPRWIWNVVRDIQSSFTSEVVAVVLNDVRRPNLPTGIQKLWATRDQLFYLLYSKLDRSLFPTKLDPLEIADISPLIKGSTRIDVVSETVDGADDFCDRDMDDILAQRLDVAIYFGTRGLRGRALGIAKHGLWTYRHGESLAASISPVSFWEVMECRSTTTSALCVLSGGSEPEKIIYRSSARNNPRSVRCSRANALWKASTFVTRKLRDLSEDGPAALSANETHNTNRLGLSDRGRPFPTNVEMLRLFSRMVGRYIMMRLRHYFETEQWFLTYDMHTPLAASGTLLRAPARPTAIIPPGDRFWADPFPIKKKTGGYYVFFEERPFVTKKGFLSVLEIDDIGRVSSPTKVLERDYHLSYPFIFEWNEDHYLIPESASNQTVELYRAVEFPYRWELDRVLLHNVNAVDATVHFLQGRWWMFVNIAVPGASSCDELHLYYADAPIGPWLPHRRNPVKSDARGARPAGKIFTYANEHYRPSQNCSTRYGGSIIINRIIRLDVDAYEETEISDILPDWQSNLVATHTINAVEGLTVMDAKRIRRRWKRSQELASEVFDLDIAAEIPVVLPRTAKRADMPERLQHDL